MNKKIFSLLVLLMTAVSGAWAEDTYRIDAVFSNGTSELNSTIADAATLPCTKKLRELDAEIAVGENLVSAEDFTVTSGDNIEIGTEAGFDTEITFTKAGTGTISFNLSTNGASMPITVTLTVTKNGLNYYLVGTMNDWEANKQFQLTQNTDNTTNVEYMITLNLQAGAQFKVIGVGENTTWYPGDGKNNYYVNTAGKYTVYFRPNYDGNSDWHEGCIYAAAAPAPAIPLTDLGNNSWEFTMPAYAVVAKIEYDTELELKEESTNTALLADWDGYEANITLKRTQLTGGMWNTLALPFAIEADKLTLLKKLFTQQGGYFEVKQLASSTLEGETLTLNFADATSIEAGKPYLVKISTDLDLSTNAFSNVEVSKELIPATTTYADFIPTLGKTTIENVSADDILFVAANNTLLNPQNIPAYMKGFRGYFQLKDGATAARSFNLNIDGETTAVSDLKNNEQIINNTCYDLQGRRMESQPTKKGVYIVNGKKVVIK